MGGIGQKQQTQTQPSISCLPGVTTGAETSATHHCKQPLHKDADDGQFSQASASFFQRSPAPRLLHGKMAQSRQDLHVPTHCRGRTLEGWVVFSCAAAAQREQFKCGGAAALGICRDSAPGLVGMFVSCFMGSDYTLV